MADPVDSPLHPFLAVIVAAIIAPAIGMLGSVVAFVPAGAIFGVVSPAGGASEARFFTLDVCWFGWLCGSMLSFVIAYRRLRCLSNSPGRFTIRGLLLAIAVCAVLMLVFVRRFDHWIDDRSGDSPRLESTDLRIDGRW